MVVTLMANEVQTKPQKKSKQKPAVKTTPRVEKLPPYNVVLLDDNEHTYAYVIEMMRSLFAYPSERGFKIADEVTNTGRVIVITTHRELAELKRDQIHAYGGDWRIAGCQGAMTATVEPAPA